MRNPRDLAACRPSRFSLVKRFVPLLPAANWECATLARTIGNVPRLRLLPPLPPAAGARVRSIVTIGGRPWPGGRGRFGLTVVPRRGARRRRIQTLFLASGEEAAAHLVSDGAEFRALFSGV
jgi:hypothetical protein